jgi:HK97 family phage portal protein
MTDGARRYMIGSVEIPPREMLHIRYQSTVDDAHGHGPLEAGGQFVAAAGVLARYATGLADAGGIPSSIITYPEGMDPGQAQELKDQWVAARRSSLGEPAVLSGGITWTPTQLNPKDMALLDLQQHNESRVAIMLGVPPFLVGLPSGGDSMTYSNVNAIFDFHWRAGLRPKADHVMSALSEWLLPRGTLIELNKDTYVQPEPLQRAQVYQILNSIQDADGNPVLSVQQIQQIERLTNATPQEGAIT